MTLAVKVALNANTANQQPTTDCGSILFPGRVCVPIDPDNIDSFNPFEVPTIRCVQSQAFEGPLVYHKTLKFPLVVNRTLNPLPHMLILISSNSAE